MKNLKSSIVFFLLVLISTSLLAQVGIGTTTPDPQAALDIQSSDQGILVPRIADHTTISPTASSDFGLLVYDTSTNSFWYWNGTTWNEVWSSSASNAWELTGNSGTSPGTNYIGTSDDNDLVIARNGTEGIRVLADQVSVNATTLVVGDRFTVQGASGEYAVNGYVTGSGAGVYGENSDASGYGVWGNAANIGVLGGGAVGVYGSVDGSTYFGVLAENDNSSGTGLLVIGNGAAGTYLTSGTAIAANGDGIAVFGYGRNTTNGTGIVGAGNNGSINTLTDGSGVAGTGENTGIYGIATDTSGGTGVIGVGNNESVNTLTNGSGGAFTGIDTGVYGVATAADGVGVYGVGEGNRSVGVYGISEDTGGARYGGYFEADGAYAYVGGWSNNSTMRKIVGNGNVNTIIKGVNGNLLTMTCPESPEVLFQDYGIGELINGYSRIKIDPNFSKNIRVDSEHPIKVFIQLEGNCNGVYVTNKSATGFEVKELNDGDSNVQFSWSIVATRADEIITREDGSTRTSINSMRFQPAPGPLKSIRKQSNKTKVIKREAKVTQTLELNELKKKQ